MKGSPVRGQERLPNIRLNESHDVQTFQAEIVRILSSEFKHAVVSFGIVDTDSKIVQLPAWIKSHLERQPGLHKKLEQGEMVGISAAEENPVLRPAAAARASIVLIPVMRDGQLIAAISLVSPSDGPQLSAEDLETARQVGYDSAPILSTLQELDKLRRETRELSAKAERAERAVKQVTALTDEKNMLVAMLQMHCHQQVNLAHELRTPLAAIRGYTRMILDGRSGEANEKQKEYLRIVTDNTNRLITLVSWMSYVADLSAHHLKLSSFDFRGLWEECATASQQKLADKSLNLEHEISDERSFAMIGDREKLAYVLEELIAVAVRLADTKQTITAALSHGREGEVTFKLSARGASITSGVLSTIFDRTFNTVANPTAQNKESSVVNLSGVYDIVGMHGGRIFVNSTGQGATFLFTLPAVTAGEEKNHEQAVNSGRRRR